MREAKAEYDAWATKVLPDFVHSGYRPKPKDFYPSGHEYKPRYVYVDSRGKRCCWSCRRAQWKASNARRRKAA